MEDVYTEARWDRTQLSNAVLIDLGDLDGGWGVGVGMLLH